MASTDDRADDTGEIGDLVRELMRTGNLHPLVGVLRDGDAGPERAREALHVLGELDLDLLVQVALDTLIAEYVSDPALAHQPLRQVRGAEGAPPEG